MCNLGSHKTAFCISGLIFWELISVVNSRFNLMNGAMLGNGDRDHSLRSKRHRRTLCRVCCQRIARSVPLPIPDPNDSSYSVHVHGIIRHHPGNRHTTWLPILLRERPYKNTLSGKRGAPDHDSFSTTSQI